MTLGFERLPRLRPLAVVPWALLAGCPALLALVLQIAPDFGPTWVTISLILFFPVLLAQLVVTALRQPERRPALFGLIAAIVLFAAGSATLTAAGPPDTVVFPAPGEGLFLASYAAFALYLVLDANRHVRVTPARALEAAVVLGGCACAVGSVLVTTAADQLEQDGLSLVLAALYPLVDVALALLVLGQVVVRQRDARDAVPLVLGFLVFGAADFGFLLRLSESAYDFGNLSILLWGVALALIVGNASTRRRLIDDVPSAGQLRVPVLLAGTAAAAVLTFQPDGTLRVWFVAGALATLAAAGALLVVALRHLTRASEAIRLSRSDDLTDLPNRRAVFARLERDLATTDPLGLMLVDLNGFKDINDTLGHQAGDAVLREIASRVRAGIGSGALCARLGGDEFALVAATEDEIELLELAQRMHDAIAQPVVIDGITLTVEASIGVTTRQATDTAGGELLRRADVAMYEAKGRRLATMLYDPESDRFSRQRLSLGDELRRAIDRQQIVLWYQPQIDATTGRVCGLEALVRWRHPGRGLLLPAEFLPAARRSGLMLALSEEIGRIAVADMQSWKLAERGVRVAVNCAPPELMSGLFAPRLAAALESAGIPADRVVIEVTEDSFLAEPERAREQLLRIRDLGLQLSVDDYGTGFSSLAYLRDLPIQELKIDRSFVTSVATDARGRMIVASTLQMASALGLRTVAEGVEDAAAVTELVTLGADVLQGYHYARPMPPEAIPGVLAAPADATSGASS